MNFRIGQKVSYPNLGICKVENIESKAIGERGAAEFYSLRVLANNSVIHVPKSNASAVGVRPIIDAAQCRRLMEFLTVDFEEPPVDWKIRVRDFAVKMQIGDAFETADVLKKLAFVARSKKLSFREQKLYEKSKFLVVSELAVVCSQAECKMELKVEQLLDCACESHSLGRIEFISAAAH